MEKNIASIYKITNKLNGKSYIGFDICYPKRIKQHYRDSQKGKKSPLCEDIRKYGWENFSKDLLYQSWDPRHCLKVMENYFIIENNSYDNGYNRTLGGNGSLGSPRPKSIKQLKQMSTYMKENNPRKGYKFTTDEKEHHSHIMKKFYEENPDKILIGEKNPMYGKEHSVEWRINHSNILKEKYKNGEMKKIEKVKCSYCDLKVVPGNLRRHENVCTKNENKQKNKKRSLLF
jgi:group I intron endonuclease